MSAKLHSIYMHLQKFTPRKRSFYSTKTKHFVIAMIMDFGTAAIESQHTHTHTYLQFHTYTYIHAYSCRRFPFSFAVVKVYSIRKFVPISNVLKSNFHILNNNTNNYCNIVLHLNCSKIKFTLVFVSLVYRYRSLVSSAISM